jgi:hypothetical protein
MSFCCVTKNSQALPEDGADKCRNTSKLNKLLAYKKLALTAGK